jgi:O-methyltransferase
MSPLEPNTVLKYPPLVREMHDALKALLFPQLPEIPGRSDLLARLLGTGVAEAMYILDGLHAGLRDGGDVCEFGVAQGATSALLANEIRDTGSHLWLYDSFRGLPKPSSKDELKDDIFGLGSMARYEGEMRCEQAEVETRLAQIGIPVDRYTIRSGFVDETLREGTGPAGVSLAYIDFDFYEPIVHALEYLDRHLTPNGRIVVDDYDHFSTGVKTAVDEFVRRSGSRYEFSLPLEFAGKFCLLRKPQ